MDDDQDGREFARGRRLEEEAGRDRAAMFTLLAILAILVFLFLLASAYVRYREERESGGVDPSLQGGSSVDDATLTRMFALNDAIDEGLRADRGYPFADAVAGLPDAGTALADLDVDGLAYGPAQVSPDGVSTRFATVLAVGGKHPAHVCFVLRLDRKPTTEALADWTYESQGCSPSQTRAVGDGSREIDFHELDG
ncbi:hypothetical protein [Schumannella sp. 10F1B-5-1]|uniref:hypothetical protein n=1 Tax=Schumannella sp. 10F1B-5-1 TaxID=2590780 RepID=UPI001130819B|nr:hypothetical protein [Schumannella sp. 10F1B-5-1]TPW71653.1 hypothetical protein FJ658_09890 [Schumannella sp. 10F1B-5-1]